jgi:hypothetical protein
MATYLADTPVEWKTPTLGFYLRLGLGVEQFWLQFITPVLGLLWLVWYLKGRRNTWDWLEILPAVLWAGVLASPYSWTYDQVVLLIPVIAVTVGLLRDGWTRPAWRWMGIFWLINLMTLVLHRYFTDEFFIWLAPLLLLWYWLARRSLHAENPVIAA